jgi:tetratricopeptide (TPR) repeat protein
MVLLDNKAAALNNLGNYTGAIEFYDKSLAIDPKNTYGLTNKLTVKSKTRITQAMKLFSEGKSPVDVAED